jgi:hypothetical protein
MMVLVNLCVKERNPLVKYHFSQPFIVNNDTFTLNDVNFHIPTLIKEVKRLSKNKIKEYKKISQTFLVAVSSFLILPLRSMASTLPNAIPVTSNLPKSAEGIPPELLALLIQLLTIAVGGAVFVAAIMLAVTGIAKMFRVKGITQWTSDILKGLFQALAAIPVVFLIYYLATLLFKGNGWWISPF